MLARKFLIIILANIGGALLTLVAQKFMALYLGPAAIGQYAYALSLVVVVSILADLGFNQAHLKRVSEGQDLGASIGTYLTIKLLLTAASVVVFLVALYGWERALDRPLVTTTEATVLILLAYAALREVAVVALQTFDALRETVFTQTALFVDYLVRVPLVIGACLLVLGAGGRGPLRGAPTEWKAWVEAHQPEAIAAAQLLGTLAVVLVAYYLMRHHPLRRPNWTLARHYATFAVPFLAFSAASLLSARADRILVGFFFDEAEVAYFALVQGFVGVLAVIPSAVYTLLLPTISERAARAEGGEVGPLVRDAARYIAILLAPPLAFMMAFPGLTIDIALAANFLPARVPLILLCLQTLLAAVVAPTMAFLMGHGLQRTALRLSILLLTANLVLGLLLIPDHGLVLAGVPVRGAAGAALANLLATALSLALYRAAGRASPHHAVPVLPLRPLVAAAVPALLLWVGARSLHLPTRWYVLVLLAAAQVLLYGLFLWALRVFRPAEVRFLRRALHPVELLRHVRAEMETRR